MPRIGEDFSALWWNRFIFAQDIIIGVAILLLDYPARSVESVCNFFVLSCYFLHADIVLFVLSHCFFCQICRTLDESTTDLEASAFPALDALTLKVYQGSSGLGGYHVLTTALRNHLCLLAFIFLTVTKTGFLATKWHKQLTSSLLAILLANITNNTTYE